MASSSSQDDDHLLNEMREMIVTSFYGLAFGDSLRGDSSPGDSSGYDSDEINMLLEDSLLAEGSSSYYHQQQLDDELIEATDLVRVMERISSAHAVTKRSILFLFELAKRGEDNVNLLVGSGIVPALVKHLQATQWPDHVDFDLFGTGSWPLDHELDSYQKVLNRLLDLMHNNDKNVQTRVLLGLARFCLPDDLEEIFLHNNGLDLLLENLKSYNHQGLACAALCKLAKIGTSVSPFDAGPSSPISQVYVGAYMNDQMVSDVTFIIEGKRYFAHRIILIASSDIFRAMFAGGYKESDAKDVHLQGISLETFEMMMRFIYTGSVEVNMGIAQDLLKAADQYLLDGLKRLCEDTMAREITSDNLLLMYDLSKTYNAVSLRNACILFVLDQFDILHFRPWYSNFVLRIVPEIRSYLVKILAKPMEANSQQ